MRARRAASASAAMFRSFSGCACVRAAVLALSASDLLIQRGRASRARQCYWRYGRVWSRTHFAPHGIRSRPLRRNFAMQDALCARGVSGEIHENAVALGWTASRARRAVIVGVFTGQDENGRALRARRAGLEWRCRCNLTEDALCARGVRRLRPCVASRPTSNTLRARGVRSPGSCPRPAAKTNALRARGVRANKVSTQATARTRLAPHGTRPRPMPQFQRCGKRFAGGLRSAIPFPVPNAPCAMRDEDIICLDISA